MKRRAVNKKDVLYILEHLRSDDLEELQALWGKNWKENVLNNIINTDFTVLVGHANNRPVCMGGIWNDVNNPSCAIVWLLSTGEIKHHIISLLKEIKVEIAKADLKYHFLYNIIYEKNVMAMRFLKKLGFCFDCKNRSGLKIPSHFQFFYKIRR